VHVLVVLIILLKTVFKGAEGKEQRGHLSVYHEKEMASLPSAASWCSRLSVIKGFKVQGPRKSSGFRYVLEKFSSCSTVQVVNTKVCL
jgi:hypothetical protein